MEVVMKKLVSFMDPYTIDAWVYLKDKNVVARYKGLRPDGFHTFRTVSGFHYGTNKDSLAFPRATLAQRCADDRKRLDKLISDCDRTNPNCSMDRHSRLSRVSFGLIEPTMLAYKAQSIMTQFKQNVLDVIDRVKRSGETPRIINAMCGSGYHSFLLATFCDCEIVSVDKTCDLFEFKFTSVDVVNEDVGDFRFRSGDILFWSYPDDVELIQSDLSSLQAAQKAGCDYSNYSNYVCFTLYTVFAKFYG